MKKIILLICSIWIAVPAAAEPLVKVEGRKLLTDFNQTGTYQPYVIKGVGYNPDPIGRHPSDWGYAPSDPRPIHNIFNDPDILNRDFPIIKAMGANTIRIWGGQDSSQRSGTVVRFPNRLTQTTLDIAEANGIKVIAGFWVNGLGGYSCTNGQSVYGTGIDVKDPNMRNQLMQNFKAYVRAFKDHKAILFWAIGNENNLQFNYSDPQQIRAWYSLVNDMAKAAHEVEGPNYHPVAVVNGDLGFVGDANASSADAQMPDLDIWGSNVYRGQSFGNLFSSYKSLSTKPLWISEFGLDAWHVDDPAKQNPDIGHEDTLLQAQWDGNLWDEIAANTDVAIGGTIMAYSDQWWQPYEWLCGSSSEYCNGTQNHFGTGPRDISCPVDGIPDTYPAAADQYDNQEWYGMVSIRKNPDPKKPDIVTPRPVYATLQSKFVASDPETNQALATAGTSVTASSTFNDPNYPQLHFAATSINDGEAAGANWERDGGWNDGTFNAFPDRVDFNFNGLKTITRAVVYTVQDHYQSPTQPDETMTFNLYGITDFMVLGWDGRQWQVLGSVHNNNLVKRTVTFAPFTTDRIRIEITNAKAGYSRITEVEAWGTSVTEVPFITLLSPSGGDVWETAQVKTITWKASSDIRRIAIDLHNGFAGFKLTEDVPNTGSYTFTKDFLGNYLFPGNYRVFIRDADHPEVNAQSSGSVHVVGLVPTRVVLRTFFSPAPQANRVSFLAEVFPPFAEGSVNFLDGNVSIPGCQPELTRGGAFCETDDLSPGEHIIRAVYHGNASFASATSNSVVQVITAPSQLKAFDLGIDVDRVGQPNRLKPDGAPDDRIHLEGLHAGEIVKLRIENDNVGVWESPFNGINWNPLMVRDGNEADIWFSQFPSKSFRVFLEYADGHKESADALKSSPNGTDEAEFVSQMVPLVMVPGQVGQVRITMRNTGTSTWQPDSSALSSYVLSLTPAASQVWGVHKVGVPRSPILPGRSVDFEFSIVAPGPGAYHFQWHMAHESVGTGPAFGQPTADLIINVEPQDGPLNVALSSAGAVASSSSTFDHKEYPQLHFSVSSINDNDHSGGNWESNGGWNDDTPGIYPDHVQIDFNGFHSINKVVVYTLKDNYGRHDGQDDPGENATFSKYGVVDFKIQSRQNGKWVDVPGAVIVGNRNIKRTIQWASPVLTDAIRVVVTSAMAQYSRIVEVEAWEESSNGI